MKNLILLFVAVFVVNSAFSQFQIGPRFGLNFSKQKGHTTGTVSETYYGSYNDNVRNKLGLQVGLMMNFGGNHFFNFQPEFMYVMRGYKLVDNNNEFAYQQKNNYLDINLLFNLGKTVNEKWRIYAIVGPAIDIWLSKAGYNSNDEFQDGTDEFYFDDIIFNAEYTDIRVDISLVLGAGFKYKLGPGWLILSPRYKWGFIPQHSEKYLQTNDNDYFYLTNKGFYLEFGYAFQFGSGDKKE